MKRYTREELLDYLQSIVEEGNAIIATAAGIGLTAKCQEIAGCDMILVDSLAKIRMMGSSSLAGTNSFKDSYKLMEEESSEIAAIVKKVPLIAGIMTTVDMYDYDAIVEDFQKKGFSGFCNSPSFGYSKKYAKIEDGDLKSQGYGYGYEVDVIKRIHDKGIFTMAYAYTPYQAELMAKAGADVIVCHVGLTKGGLTGSVDYLSLDEASEKIKAMADRAYAVNKDVIVLCSGGPMETPQDVEYVLNKADGKAVGFVSCSPSDRIPMEEGIPQVIREFKANKLKK